MTTRNYRKARRRVKGKKIFFYHLSVYLAIGAFLFSMNMLTDPWDIWFPYPLLSWGLLLFFHYLIAVGIPFFNLGKKWEEREIDREMRKIEKQKTGQDDSPIQRPEMEEELELKDFKQLRREWDDQEFV